ncbi:hypothetical protein ACHWQZ_G007857 [Mnemiopsis leidyi]
MSVLYEEKTNIILCIDKNQCEQVKDMTSCELLLPASGLVTKAAFKVTLKHKQTTTLSDTMTMKTFAKAMEYVILEGEFALSIENTAKRKRSTTKISYRANTKLYSTTAGFNCNAGYGKIGDFCSECPKGYFLNSSNLECERCSIGYFTDQEGANQCTECPPPLTTFQDRSTSTSDCISKCTVKSSNNGTEEPPAGWSVTAETIIAVECMSGHSLPYGSSNTYKCDEEAPNCYAKCTLDKLPDDVMLLPNDTTSTQLVHNNKTTVACVDFVHYHTLTCDNGILDWPTCDDISFSSIGDKIYILFIAVLALGAVTFVLFVLTQSLSRKHLDEFKGGNFASVQTNIENPLEKPIVSLPIHVEEFSKRVETFNNGGISRWKKEFNLIPKDDPEQQKTIALATYNRRKNKSGARGIVPYDISRVKLGKEDNPLKDYYNASYINGWKGPRMYIVAQTPLPHTRDDFWQMITEQKSRILINIHPSEDANNPSEYYKYWPDHDGLYGNVLVKRLSSTAYDGFIVRQFRAGPVEWPESEREKSVTPDKDVKEEEEEENAETNKQDEDKSGAKEEEEAGQEESEAEETAEGNTSATNLTGVSATNVTSATNLTTTEAEAKSGEDEKVEKGDDGTKSVYSEAVAKSIKSALSQRSARTSASSGKYRIDLPYQHSIIVKQLHLTRWNEAGEPDMTALQNMIYFYRDITKFNIAKAPIIMHSEYGSDWASLFCASDYILDRLISETDINIAGLTNAMRQQRPMMIATVQQYIYFHNLVDVILERDDYEDMKYIGFKVNPQELLEKKVEEKSSSAGSASSSSGIGALESVRAASRAVQDGTRSVAKSVASVTQTLFKKVSSAGTSALSSIQEESNA